MSRIIPSNEIVPQAKDGVKSPDYETPYDLGRDLGDTAWEQLESDADAALCLSELFCAMLALPSALDALNFIRCLCQLLGIVPPASPALEAARHFVEAVYIGFSETLIALQEDAPV